MLDNWGKTGLDRIKSGALCSGKGDVYPNDEIQNETAHSVAANIQQLTITLVEMPRCWII